ncbi:MAG: 2-dehydropantoate 2-reductase [Microbacteriaceae bacterium]|jgi:2-dehydropantoate 2-reductase|nr:2-dehydropantoate 2-reductase [Microbacteriaceae bacterium]
MRIAVIGAGAVGGAVAALLNRGGHDVEVTARGAHLDAIRESGIRLGGAWGDHVARVDANEALSRPAELVIVATKAQDAADAITSNLDAISDAPLLVVQNGLEGLGTAGAASTRSPIVGGLAMFAASHLTPGAVTITTPNRLYLGGDDAAAVAGFLSVLEPVMPVTALDDVAGAQWTKLVVNQLNALPAVTGMSAQDVISHGGLRRVLTASMRENVLVGQALGVHFASLGGLSAGGLRAFAAAPYWAAQSLPLLMRRRMGPTPNPGSTLQSIRRGQPSEIDYLNGAVVAAGMRADVETPINALIVRLVHEVEQSRAFVVPEIVIARVATAGA